MHEKLALKLLEKRIYTHLKTSAMPLKYAIKKKIYIYIS